MVQYEEKDEETKKKTLLIDIPTILFPSVRALVARLVYDSGFPPFNMPVVDFAEMYEQKQKGASAAQQPANQ